MASMRRVIIAISLLAGLAGCGGEVSLTCDEVEAYQLATPGKRVTAPDDLDDLEPLREMPMPKASPQPTRPEGSPCIDLPPTVTIGS